MLSNNPIIIAGMVLALVELVSARVEQFKGWMPLLASFVLAMALSVAYAATVDHAYVAAVMVGIQAFIAASGTKDLAKNLLGSKE